MWSLVERLRAESGRIEGEAPGGSTNASELLLEAADMVESLVRANQQWEAAAGRLSSVLHDEIGSDGSIYNTVLDEAIGVLRHWKREFVKVRFVRDEENASLSAEVCRLREALRHVASVGGRGVVRGLARRALEESYGVN